MAGIVQGGESRVQGTHRDCEDVPTARPGSLEAVGGREPVRSGNYRKTPTVKAAGGAG